MLKAAVALLFVSTLCIAQSSPDGSFTVRHLKNAKFSLTPAQMREAEKLYQSACAVVKMDFQRNMPGHSEALPRVTVVVGTDHNEVHGRTEIWLTKWDPGLFVEGVVVLTFDRLLSPDMIKELVRRAVRFSNATVDVAELK